ncbi:MAG TPA: hypothetical protein VK147_02880 [Candidatus Didemnitutus sp.]|nr:hypothetical protein [Candidatus Didemnitutus sp.]
MIRSVLFALAAVFVLSACSDDPVTPSDTSSYVVSTKGSYFVHDNITVEITAAGVTTDVPSPSDSTVVNGSVTHEGRTAIESIVFVNGAASDSIYMTQTGSTVATAFPLQFTVLGLPADFGVKWVNIFDANAATWTALNDSIPSFTIGSGEQAYTGTAKLLFTGKQTGTETITVDGKSVTAKKSEITMNITLYLNFGTAIIPVPIVLTQRYTFAPNVGIVRAEQVATVITIEGVPPLTIPGFKTSLVRYSVAN